MPNGYTAAIVDGKDLTAAGYLRRAARGFGFAIRQRDSDPDEPVKRITEETYYAKRLAEAIAEKARWEGLSDAERHAEYADYVADNEKHNRESQRKADRNRARLDAIRDGVNSAVWPDQLENMHQTVVKWLDETAEYDAKAYIYETKPFAQWCDDRKKSVNRDVEYYTKQVAEEKQRVIEQNAYMDLFENVVAQVEEWENS